VLPPDRLGTPDLRGRTAPDQDANALVRLAGRIARSRQNFGVEKVEHLGPGVGYLKMEAFAPPFLSADRIAGAMDKLADTDALIIDVRGGNGGHPAGVALLVSYFVDQRTRLNDLWSRDTGKSTEFWTEDRLEGKRYGSRKPVVILVDRETKSGTEDFAYTMQALKRATVVGTRTWGGAHPGRPWRLGDHFIAGVPDARSVSPITHSNWEGVGVIPDVEAAPGDALKVAQELLQRRTRVAAVP
jgi:C-terminal processing protease CtpA/Prc